MTETSTVETKTDNPVPLTAGLPHRVFVYGTLQSGRPNHHVLGLAPKFQGAGKLHGYVMLHLGGFPAIVKVQDSGWEVNGEVWDISEEAFKRCDRLEGVDVGFYERVTVNIDGFGAVQTYIQGTDQLFAGRAFIPSGRWLGSADSGQFIWSDNMKPGDPLIVVPSRKAYNTPTTRPPLSVVADMGKLDWFKCQAENCHGRHVSVDGRCTLPPARNTLPALTHTPPPVVKPALTLKGLDVEPAHAEEENTSAT